MIVGKAESDVAKVIQLFPDVLDETQDLCVRIDHRSTCDGKPARSRAGYAAAFIHQQRSPREALGDRNSLALARIQTEFRGQCSYFGRIRGLGHEDPIGESAPDRLIHGVTNPPDDHFFMHGRRNNKGLVDLPKRIKIGKKCEVVQWTAVGNNRTHGLMASVDFAHLPNLIEVRLVKVNQKANAAHPQKVQKI